MKDCAINYNMVSIELLWRACKFIKIYYMVELFNNYDYFVNFLYTKFHSNDNVEEKRGTFIKEITEIQLNKIDDLVDKNKMV